MSVTIVSRAFAVSMPNREAPETSDEWQRMCPLVRRFATCGSLFAAVVGAMLARAAQNPRMRRKAGFFRVSFAGAVNYASFEAWKSSFAK
jgi:hypothetical protein